MKKMSMIAAVAALFVAASSAGAGTINLYFSGASSTGSTCPAFSQDNPTLYLGTPSQDAAINASQPGFGASYHTGSLYLYMDVATRAGGPGDEIVSSLGLNVNATNTGGTASLTATGFNVFNTAAETGASAAPWSPSGVNTPTVGAAPALVTNSRAVAVPESTTSSLWGGYAPGATHYRVAQLSLSAGDLGAGEGQTSYSLFMAVDSLKITRVYDPTSANPNQPTPEDVSFGYNGASPDATVSGSTVGATSAIADATVIVRKKGDFGSVDQNSGDFVTTPDGSVDSDDIAYFFSNPNNRTDAEFIYLGDFGSVDQNSGDFVSAPDCSADSDDIAFMFSHALGS
jgi:hypothetical protein